MLYVVFLDEHAQEEGYVIADNKRQAEEMKELIKALKYWYPYYKRPRITSRIDKLLIRRWGFEKTLKTILKAIYGVVYDLEVGE